MASTTSAPLAENQADAPITNGHETQADTSSASPASNKQRSHPSLVFRPEEADKIKTLLSQVKNIAHARQPEALLKQSNAPTPHDLVCLVRDLSQILSAARLGQEVVINTITYIRANDSVKSITALRQAKQDRWNKQNHSRQHRNVSGKSDRSTHSKDEHPTDKTNHAEAIHVDKDRNGVKSDLTTAGTVEGGDKPHQNGNAVQEIDSNKDLEHKTLEDTHTNNSAKDPKSDLKEIEHPPKAEVVDKVEKGDKIVEDRKTVDTKDTPQSAENHTNSSHKDTHKVGDNDNVNGNNHVNGDKNVEEVKKTDDVDGVKDGKDTEGIKDAKVNKDTKEITDTKLASNAEDGLDLGDAEAKVIEKGEGMKHIQGEGVNGQESKAAAQTPSPETKRTDSGKKKSYRRPYKNRNGSGKKRTSDTGAATADAADTNTQCDKVDTTEEPEKLNTNKQSDKVEDKTTPHKD